MEKDNINWTRIAEAVENYRSLGFKYVETPWIVSREAALLTCPHERYLDHADNHGVLAASAEQGFLQLAMDGELDSVNYVSSGPCFRIKDTLEHADRYHKLYFMKVELFSRCRDESEAVHAYKEMMGSAINFMRNYLDGQQSPDARQTRDGWDLELNQIEVGSYGYRYDDRVGWWAYGTGIAEPRFSQAL